jgi:hypothetical protein
MPDEIERVLFTEAQIAQRVRELGQQISHDYAKLLGEKLDPRAAHRRGVAARRCRLLSRPHPRHDHPRRV